MREIEVMLRQLGPRMPEDMERRIRAQIDGTDALEITSLAPIELAWLPARGTRRRLARVRSVAVAAAGTAAMCTLVLGTVGSTWSTDLLKGPLSFTEWTDRLIPRVSTAATSRGTGHSRQIGANRVVHSKRPYDYTKPLGFQPVIGPSMPPHYVLERLEVQVLTGPGIAPKKTFEATYKLPNDPEHVIVIREMNMKGQAGVPKSVNLPKWRSSEVKGQAVLIASNPYTRNFAMANVKDGVLYEVVGHTPAPGDKAETDLLERVLFRLDRPIKTWPDAVVRDATGRRETSKVLTFKPQFPKVVPAGWRSNPNTDYSAWTTKSVWVSRETFAAVYSDGKSGLQLLETLGNVTADSGASTLRNRGRSFTLVSSSPRSPVNVLSWYDAKRNLTFSMVSSVNVQTLLKVARSVPE